MEENGNLRSEWKVEIDEVPKFDDDDDDDESLVN